MGSLGALLAAAFAGTLVGGLVLFAYSFTEPPPKESKPAWLSEEVSGTVLIWVAASLVAGLLGWLASGWPAVGLAAVALVWVFKFWLRAKRERDVYFKTTEAVSTWIDMVKDSLSGGAGLSQAIESTVPVAPTILRPHVVRLATEQRTMSQSAALRRFADAVAHPTSDLVAQALITASEHQGRDVPKLLAKTSEQARARNAAVLQTESERAQLYTEAWIMVGAIGLLGTIITLVARDYFAPYDTVLGQLVLTGLMAVVVGSIASLVHAGRPQKELRLLAVPGQAGSQRTDARFDERVSP